MVRLKKIDVENYQDCLNLKVTAEQSAFIESNAVSLAEAWVFPYSAIPLAIYWNNKPVGFIMLSYDSEAEHYGIWRLMIDYRFQGLGLAKSALEEAIDYMSKEFRAEEIYTTIKADNEAARQLFVDFGFKKIRETEEGEVVMRLIASN